MNAQDNLQDFVHEGARELRVLHIGNIANNGYNIANLFNQAGVSSDLIIGPYYHIAGCPEWEDAEFEGEVGDQFYPQWHKVKIINGFKRPKWAAQGPWETSIDYLLHRNKGNKLRAGYYWWVLKLSQRFAQNPQGVKIGNAVGSPKKVVQKIVLGGKNAPARLVWLFKNTIYKIVWHLKNTIYKSIWYLKNATYKFIWYASVLIWHAKNSVWYIKRAIWSVKNSVYLTKYWLIRGSVLVLRALLKSTPLTMLIYTQLRTWNRKRIKSRPSSQELDSARSISTEVNLTPTSENERVKDAIPQKLERDNVEAQVTPELIESDICDGSSTEGSVEDDLHLDEPVHQGRHDFDLISNDELVQYGYLVTKLKPLFEYYDVIVGYSTDGIWPLLAGEKYIAYEHGTIRTLPFEDTLQGRICRTVYENADATIISNFDNNLAAEKMQLQNYTCIPHYINEMFVAPEAGLKLRKELCEKHGADFIVYNPSRQHWSDKKDGGWEKGNDIMIRGFAEFIHKVNPNALGIFTYWGESIEQSKELLKTLGIDKNIIWVDPVPHKRMIEYIQASHVVSDQFLLSTFGGIPAKAFMHGRPVLSSFDPAIHEWCFDSMPPFLPSRSENRVFESLKRVYKEPDYYQEVSKSSQNWYRSHHSNEVLLSKMSRVLAFANQVDTL